MRRSRSDNTRGSSLGNFPMQLVVCFISLLLVLSLQCSIGVTLFVVFPSAAGKSAICNSTPHGAKDQRYRQSAEMHNVLDPERKRRSTWPKGVLRGVVPRRAWKDRGRRSQLTPCGLQPGPLALSCMAMTMHKGKSLVLFHSHADSFVTTNNFWSNQFL